MIVKRGEYYHYQFQINGKRYRGSTKSTNKAEALRREAAKYTECFRNPEAFNESAEKLGFDVALDRFLSWASRHVKSGTHKRYRVSAKRLIAHFGATRIERMNTQAYASHRRIQVDSCRRVQFGGSQP